MCNTYFYDAEKTGETDSAEKPNIDTLHHLVDVAVPQKWTSSNVTHFRGVGGWAGGGELGEGGG